MSGKYVAEFNAQTDEDIRSSEGSELSHLISDIVENQANLREIYFLYENSQEKRPLNTHELTEVWRKIS